MSHDARYGHDSVPQPTADSRYTTAARSAARASDLSAARASDLSAPCLVVMKTIVGVVVTGARISGTIRSRGGDVAARLDDT